MAQRVSLSVSLTSELAAFMAETVGSGGYGSASEVVRMALRLLEDRGHAPSRRRLNERTEDVADER